MSVYLSLAMAEKLVPRHLGPRHRFRYDPLARPPFHNYVVERLPETAAAAPALLSDGDTIAEALRLAGVPTDEATLVTVKAELEAKKRRWMSKGRHSRSRKAYNDGV